MYILSLFIENWKAKTYIIFSKNMDSMYNDKNGNVESIK